MSVRWVTQKNGSGADVRFVMIDVTYRHPDGRTERVRKTAEIQNLREAKREEATILASLAAGTYKREPTPPETLVPSNTPTVTEFSRSFLETYAATNNKPSEVESKRSILTHHLLPFFGAMALDAVKVEHVERYKSVKLTAEYDPKTINNHLTVLRRMLSLAHEWERIPSVPRIKWLRRGVQEFRFLPFEETASLIAAGGEWGPMILIAARTGLRIGELLALRWCDVDLANGRITVRRAVARGKIGTPKSGKGREVPLSDEAVATLRAMKQLRRGEDLVFCGPGGRLLTRGEVKWPLWSACARAEIARCGWHVLRHTFASHLAIRGVPVKAIQELLRHSTIQVTMRYAHLSPDVKREAVRLLDGVANGKQEANGASRLPPVRGSR
jgi:integrase